MCWANLGPQRSLTVLNMPPSMNTLHAASRTTNSTLFLTLSVRPKSLYTPSPISSPTVAIYPLESASKSGIYGTPSAP